VIILRVYAAMLVLMLSNSSVMAQGIAPTNYPLPVYAAPHITEAISIDGRISEAAWSNAPVIQLRHTGTTELPDKPTTVRCLWDDQYLYVAFHTEDTDIWATMKTPETELWNEEVVEVFIDADSDERGYAELQVNPLGVPVDLWILHDTEREYHQGLMEYDCKGFQYAVSVAGTVDNRQDTDEYWETELAIPFADLVTAPNIPPKPGDTWRINFYRLERPADPEDLIPLAWSPCFAWNHTPKRFGTIVFVRD
jgi:hypothetical protein